MKAVIVEVRGKLAAALSDDGCITKIKNNNYVIGQVIEVKKTISKKKSIMPKIAVAAACVIMLGGVGAYAYMTPSAYVSLDVNPSIEYSLNMFDRVLSAKAVNDDGAEILKQVDLKNMSNKTIDEAIKMTVEEISKEGYFDGETEGGIVITTSGKDLKKSAELAESLKETADEKIKEDELDVEVEALAVGKDRVEEAKALGVTPGKLNLVQKLQASASNPEEINVNDWLNKSVKEIMKATKENKKANKNQDASSENELTDETSSQAQESSSESSSEADTSVKTDTPKNEKANENALKNKKADETNAVPEVKKPEKVKEDSSSSEVSTEIEEEVEEASQNESKNSGKKQDESGAVEKEKTPSGNSKGNSGKKQ